MAHAEPAHDVAGLAGELGQSEWKHPGFAGVPLLWPARNWRRSSPPPSRLPVQGVQPLGAPLPPPTPRPQLQLTATPGLPSPVWAYK